MGGDRELGIPSACRALEGIPSGRQELINRYLAVQEQDPSE
jgi:hypothetical protein